MGFITKWVHEPQILATTYSGHVTGDDFKISMLEHLQTLQMQPLYMVLDFTESDGMPFQFFNMPTLLQIINHKNLQWLLVVNHGVQQRTTAQLLVRPKVKVFRDVPTALAFLRGMVRIDTGIILAKSP